MIINNIIENNLILYGIISVCILILFAQTITIESKFILKFFGEIIKNIFAIFILSKITISSIKIISEASKGSSIIKVLNLFYDNFIWVILILMVFYSIDKFTQKKISDSYLKYAIYSLNLVIYSTLCLKKSIWIIVLSCLLLMILKLNNYKKIINNKYESLINIIGKIKCAFYFILGFIVTFSSVVSIINEPKNISILIAYILCYLIIFNIYRIDKKEEESEPEINELSDKEVDSIDKLFETRKKELAYIVRYFNKEVSKIDEPFAISISGKWGEGKSSLTNVLKKELQDKYIIFDIQPMVTDTREGLIKYFFSNLEKKFIYYGLSAGNGSSIENYFSSILKLIDNKGLISIKQEVKNIKSSKFDLRDKKNDLQEDIKLLLKESQKEILIVVDDFDRVDNEVKYSILTFIKEIVNFNGIKSLILLDYSTLNNETENKITYEFLEKFINKRFELSKLSVEEILEYYKTKLNEEDNKLEDSLDIELDNVLKNIKPEIDKIVSSIEDKIDKYEKNIKDLENSINKREHEIKYKKISIENLKNLNSKIKEGIGNTRKIKRIIREVKEKVEYIKYIYSEFDNLEKKELIRNINLSNLIITMVLIKVLYEEEFDNILRSKDLLNYIKSRNDSEIYELIYCSIFKESDKVRRAHGMNTEDPKLVKLINNIFICINTPSDILDFSKYEEKLLHIINTKPIDFRNDKTVFENIKDVYKNVDYFKLKGKMKYLSEYMSEKLKKGEIGLNNAIQLIKTERTPDGITKENKNYINTLKECLIEQDITYNHISQKESDERTLDMCVMDAIDSVRDTVAFIISYKNIEYKGDSFYKVREELVNIYKIEDINGYAIKKIIDIKLDDSLNEIDKFSQWAYINGTYDSNINTEKINKEVELCVNILKDLDFIRNKVKTSKLENRRDNYENMDYEGIIRCLGEFEQKSEKKLDNEQLYKIVLEFSRITYLLDIEYINNVTIENIETLDNISSNIYRNLEYYDQEYDQDIEAIWRAIQLSILGIKKNKKQLKKIEKISN